MWDFEDKVISEDAVFLGKTINTATKFNIIQLQDGTLYCAHEIEGDVEVGDKGILMYKANSYGGSHVFIK